MFLLIIKYLKILLLFPLVIFLFRSVYLWSWVLSSRRALTPRAVPPQSDWSVDSGSPLEPVTTTVTVDT